MEHSINPGDNNLYIIKHIASQTGSTPVHLNKESIKGLRNLHNLVHNEDVGHDFSKLKTLFAQPNIAVYLKGQIEQKKANGGIINDYINTLKHNGSEENSELSLAPDELIKFLDDSGYPYMTNPHTGHKEYHLGKMFDGLNNIFKPIKDSMGTREHHGWGDMIGGLGSTAYNAASTLGKAAYDAGAYAAPIVGNAAYNATSNVFGTDAADKLSSAASTLGKAAYDTGAYVAPMVGSAASTIGKAAYDAGKYVAPTIIGGAASTPEDAASQPSRVQNIMRGIAGPIGGAIGGLGAQFAGQKIGQKLGEGIPFVGPFVSPIAGNIAGNLGYKAGAYKGRNKGIELADRFYNYLGGSNTSAPAPAPAPTFTPAPAAPTSTSYFPTFSGFGNTAYNAASKLGNKAYDTAMDLGNSIYQLGNNAYQLGTNAYNATSNAARAAYDKLPSNPFANLYN